MRENSFLQIAFPLNVSDDLTTLSISKIDEEFATSCMIVLHHVPGHLNFFGFFEVGYVCSEDDFPILLAQQ